MSGKVGAIVPAAGAGLRVGGPLNKLLIPVAGKPLLAHTLLALQKSALISGIALVVRKAEKEQLAALVKRYKITKTVFLCIGGDSRAESVSKGLRVIPTSARWILVHDGARPCIDARLIRRSIQAVMRHGAVVCGVPAAATVKSLDGQRRVRATLNRERLWLAQTPQVFRRDWFTQALSRVSSDDLARFPDDASLLEAAGFRVTMIPGDPLNLKVTTKDDLVFAEAILRRRSIGKT